MPQPTNNAATDKPSGKGKKNGIPLYPNLVNLKSNTMKNTMQRYGLFAILQELVHSFLEIGMFFSLLPFILLTALDTAG